MTSKKTEVVFRRPKGTYDDHDPSTWNDNAIVEAYDKALNFKPTDKLSHDKASITNASTPNGSSKTPEPLWERAAGISIPNEQDRNIEWKVNDKCVAKYAEDDLYYDAIITSIDKKNYSCEVEFTGYGNKEIISLHDVHHENRWNEAGDSLLRNMEKLNVEESSNDSSSETESSSMNESGTTTTSSSSAKPKHKRRSNKQNMPPPFMQFTPQMMGYNSNFGMSSQYPPWQNNFMPAMSSSMFNNSSPMDNNELSNLLMAWYMAGYQTGYFQGRHKKP